MGTGIKKSFAGQATSIREAELCDASTIRELAQQSGGGTRSWTQKEVKKIINDRLNYYLLVAKQDGQVVGYALSRFAWGKMHVMDIAVKREMRTQGIGKGLMQQLISHAREKQLSQVYLEVRVDNSPALKIYHGFSFKTRYIIPGAYDGKDGLAMYLPLREEH